MNRVAIAGLLALFLTAPVVAAQQNATNLKPGIPAVQAPFASLKPSATFKIGGTADYARYYWLMLAESHLTRRLFGSMVRRIDALVLATG